jgi:(p)ppGpp synthase/HD superfamily hydrolase
MSSLLNVAKSLAYHYHAGQIYGGSKPYTYHLDRVASICAEFISSNYMEASEISEVLMTLAYLHDIIEDTNIDPYLILKLFGRDIDAFLHLLTDETGENRKERKSKTYAKIDNFLNVKAEQKKQNSIDVKPYCQPFIVKFADRIANLEESLLTHNIKNSKMYLSESKEFRKTYYEGDQYLEMVMKELVERYDYLIKLCFVMINSQI